MVSISAVILSSWIGFLWMSFKASSSIGAGTESMDGLWLRMISCENDSHAMDGLVWVELLPLSW